MFASHSEMKLYVTQPVLPSIVTSFRKSQTIKEQREKSKVSPELRGRVVHNKQNLKTDTKYDKNIGSENIPQAFKGGRKESKRQKDEVAGEKSSC